MANLTEREILRNVYDADLAAIKTIYGSNLTPIFAAISISGSDDIVDAVTAKKIRVLALMGHATTSGTIKFQSDASTDLTGAIPVDDAQSLNFLFMPLGWFETAVGEKLNAVLDTMTAFDGVIVYVEV